MYRTLILESNKAYKIASETVYVLFAVQKTLFAFDRVASNAVDCLNLKFESLECCKKLPPEESIGLKKKQQQQL